MNKNQIFEKIKELLYEEVELDKSITVELSSEFRNELDLDSLEMINLITLIEEEFSISIEDELLSRIIVVNDAVEEIYKKIGGEN